MGHFKDECLFLSTVKARGAQSISLETDRAAVFVHIEIL